MSRDPGRRWPTYAVESVNTSLRLLQLLRDGGSIRLKDAAAEVGVSPSTAHRLLAMLVYHGFAVQDEARLYWPGPSLGAAPAGITWAMRLRDAVQPHLETLVSRTGETANLMIRVGANTRIITTIESSNVLRVTDRRGVVLPARHASGGKALLAELPLVALQRLYHSSAAEVSGDALDGVEFREFLRELEQCRLKGYASNTGETEEGVGAIGVTLHDAEGSAFAAISIATPLKKLRGLIQQGTIQEILSVRAAIETNLANSGFVHHAGA